MADLTRRILIAVYRTDNWQSYPGTVLQDPVVDARLSYDFDIILTLQTQQKVMVWRTHPIKKGTPTNRNPSSLLAPPQPSRSNGPSNTRYFCSAFLESSACAAAPDAAVPIEDQRLTKTIEMCTVHCALDSRCGWSEALSQRTSCMAGLTGAQRNLRIVIEPSLVAFACP